MYVRWFHSTFFPPGALTNPPMQFCEYHLSPQRCQNGEQSYQRIWVGSHWGERDSWCRISPNFILRCCPISGTCRNSNGIEQPYEDQSMSSSHEYASEAFRGANWLAVHLDQNQWCNCRLWGCIPWLWFEWIWNLKSIWSHPKWLETLHLDIGIHLLYVLVSAGTDHKEQHHLCQNRRGLCSWSTQLVLSWMFHWVPMFTRILQSFQVLGQVLRCRRESYVSSNRTHQLGHWSSLPLNSVSRMMW